MTMQRDFETERSKAQPIAEQVSTWLTSLGIEHKPIDWQRAGMLALVEGPNGELFGSMISLERVTKDELLDEVRRTMARTIARQTLGIQVGGHLIHFTPLITSASTANWLVEISFDDDQARYALIGEYIVPDATTPLGWQRTYRLYQVKKDTRCDVPSCGCSWYERKVTRNDHCVHVCQHHQDQNADLLYAWIHVNEQYHAEKTLDFLIDYYQEEAAKAIAAMNQARKQFEATQDPEWSFLSLSHEEQAQSYLDIAELALQSI